MEILQKLIFIDTEFKCFMYKENNSKYHGIIDLLIEFNDKVIVSILFCYRILENQIILKLKKMTYLNI